MEDSRWDMFGLQGSICLNLDVFSMFSIVHYPEICIDVRSLLGRRTSVGFCLRADWHKSHIAMISINMVQTWYNKDQ